MSVAGHNLAGILLVSVFVIFLDVTSTSAKNQTRYCQINIRRSDLQPHIPPLLLHPEKPEFLHPQTTHFVHIESRQNIRLVCPGQDNVFSLSKGTTRRFQDVSPQCVRWELFSVRDIQKDDVSIKDLGCEKEYTATAVSRGSCPDKKLKHIQIGFKLPKDDFVPTVDLCFDQTNYDAVYSIVMLTPAIEFRQYWTTRPDTFAGSTFYNTIGIDELYLRFKQRETMTTILGSRQIAEKYIPRTPDTKLYLARGHLAAMADFIYSAEQRSTFFYVNAAPQWQTFNDGNWRKLEESVRGFLVARNAKLVLYTGTWGNCMLEDQNGRMQAVHLYADRNKNRAVRVPAYFWKVLYDPDTKEGAAFVGINNPFLKDVSKHVFCTDICDSFKWLQWEPNNTAMGYSFCCSIEHFRRTVTSMPDLEVKSIFKPESKHCKSVDVCSKPHVRPSRSRPPGS